MNSEFGEIVPQAGAQAFKFAHGFVECGEGGIHLFRLAAKQVVQAPAGLLVG